MNLIKNLLRIGVIQALMNGDDSWKIANESEYNSGLVITRLEDKKDIGFGAVTLSRSGGKLKSLRLQDIDESLLNPSEVDYGTVMMQGDPWYYGYYHDSFGQYYLKIRVRFNGHAIALLKMPFQKEIYKDIILSGKSEIFINQISDKNYHVSSNIDIVN